MHLSRPCTFAPLALAVTLVLALPHTVTIADTASRGDRVTPTIAFWQAGDPGQRLNLRGRVLSAGGRPLSGVEVTLWQADGTGAYRQASYRRQFQSGPDGGFRLATVLPGQYRGAKHIHATLEHPGYQPLWTRILFKGDPYINARPGEPVVILEEVQTGDETILVGGVEFIMQPLGGD